MTEITSRGQFHLWYWHGIPCIYLGVNSKSVRMFSRAFMFALIDEKHEGLPKFSWRKQTPCPASWCKICIMVCFFGKETDFHSCYHILEDCFFFFFKMDLLCGNKSSWSLINQQSKQENCNPFSPPSWMSQNRVIFMQQIGPINCALIENVLW